MNEQGCSSLMHIVSRMAMLMPVVVKDKLNAEGQISHYNNKMVVYTFSWEVSCKKKRYKHGDNFWLTLIFTNINILAERHGVARAGFRTPWQAKARLTPSWGNGSVRTFPKKRIVKHVPGATGLLRMYGIESLVIFAVFWLAETFPWIRIQIEQ
jgi:hypothetical protein